MKLYTSLGPNPHAVRMFAAEKGLDIPHEKVDIRKGENREPAFLAKNPTTGLPALELDDGTVFSEITAICEYLEEKQPDPPLVGRTPEERANVRMWTRRVDLNICEPLTNGFRFAEGLKMFESRRRCLPEAADGMKAIAQDQLGWLEGQMKGRDYIAGDAITMADIVLFAFLHFGSRVGQTIDPANTGLTAWYERMSARPSAAA